ncbi:MAG: MFS transporter [Erysipelotrichaceae bacterium]|nr:MFS transporter [Erysipelotrichaceae bacterium]MDD3810099.1 MFS transporter [Erysipelotrichaceae bacterium]
MRKTNITLMVFTLMSFVLAMTAFVFNGILDKVALSLDISVANTGLLNTMYSYGAAFGVPLSLIVFRKIERTKILKIMLLVTIIMTLALVFAQNFGQLLAVRLVMGISANSYGVMAIATVLALAPQERQGRALAYYIMGSSLALVIGIPLTRVLIVVFDWRIIFWILNAIMVLSLVHFQRNLPESDHGATRLNLANEIQYFKNRNILMMILSSLMMFVGYGAFYTYITPYMLLVFPTLEKSMSIILVFLGLASFSGNLLGGQVGDRIGYGKTLLIGMSLQGLAMVLLLVFRNSAKLSVAILIFWLLSAWFAGLQLNSGIAQMTQNRSSFMLSINSTAIQLGTAIGSSMAAAVIPLVGIRYLVLIALTTSLVVVAIQLTDQKLLVFKRGTGIG